MRRKATSFRISDEVLDIIRKIRMYTKRPTHEILEEAILQYVNTNYKELLSKDVESILKETLDKDITSFIQKEKGETKKWKKLLIKFINYYILKADSLKRIVSNPKVTDKIEAMLNINESLEETYEKSLISQIKNNITEIEDYKTMKMIDTFVLEVYSLCRITEEIIDKDVFEISGIGNRIKELFNKIKETNERLQNLTKENIERIDYYSKPILEKINEKYKTNFKNIYDILEFEQQKTNLKVYKKELIKLYLYLIDEFIKYLKEVKRGIEANNLPTILPYQFITRKIIEYVNKNEILRNHYAIYKIYKELNKKLNLKSMEKTIDKIKKEVEQKE